MVFDYSDLVSVAKKNKLVAPFMVVNEDAFDENIELCREAATKYGKRVRVATKSIRVPYLIKRAISKLGDVSCGVMTFSVAECVYLAEKHDLDNFLIAYPVVQQEELSLLYNLHAQGKDVTVMVDHPAHITALKDMWARLSGRRGRTRPLRVCIDVDAGLQIHLGITTLHLGTKRSSIRDGGALQRVLDAIAEAGSDCMVLKGTMTYEAQIAGLTDSNPFTTLMNWPKRILKWLSARQLTTQRRHVSRAVLQFAKDHSDSMVEPSEFIFNGGGSGSLELTCNDTTVTEVTVGSGLLQSHLFDYYVSNKFQPAFTFALSVTRQPESNIITCQSGGFIASGEVHVDKSPIPFLPTNLQTIDMEGFGEVQTPLKVTNAVSPRPSIGDLVFFRSAKAGEIAERFNTYHVIRAGSKDNILETKTYRGDGRVFY